MVCSTISYLSIFFIFLEVALNFPILILMCELIIILEFSNASREDSGETYDRGNFFGLNLIHCFDFTILIHCFVITIMQLV